MPYVYISEDDSVDSNYTNIDLDSPVWMPFSSGTTGAPKGIIHTHRSMSQPLLTKLARFYFKANIVNAIFLKLCIDSFVLIATMVQQLSISKAVKYSWRTDWSMLPAYCSWSAECWITSIYLYCPIRHIYPFWKELIASKYNNILLLTMNNYSIILSTY